MNVAGAHSRCSRSHRAQFRVCWVTAVNATGMLLSSKAARVGGRGDLHTGPFMAILKASATVECQPLFVVLLIGPRHCLKSSSSEARLESWC